MEWNGIELHAGDKVRLTDKRPFYWNQWGKMDMYLGRVVTIKSRCLDEEKFIIEEDYGDDFGGWVFRVDDIVEVCMSDNTNRSNELGLTQYFEYKGSELTPPGTTAKIKIGNLEINLMDKTFTDEQIKNMKKMLGWDVINLKEEKE